MAMAEKLMLEVLKEMKILRVENQELRKKLNDSSRHEKWKDQKIESQKRVISDMTKDINQVRKKLSKETKQEKCVNDPTKNQESKDLSLLGVESILSYMEPNKRLIVSHRCPKFRQIEKSISFKLEKLEIADFSIVVNNTRYDFSDGQGKLGCSDPRFPMGWICGGDYGWGERVKRVVLKVAFGFFGGRTNFRVDTFRLSHRDVIERLPSDLNIDVGNIFVKSDSGYFDQFVRRCDRLVILNLPRFNSNVLSDSWVQDVKQFEMLNGDPAKLVDEIEDFSAESIYIYFHDMVHCLDIIRGWCQKLDRKIGSKLFLVFHWQHENTLISAINNSDELKEIGFVAASKDILQKPMENESKVRLTIREDKDHFSKEFKEKSQFRKYLCLEVVALSGKTGPKKNKARSLWGFFMGLVSF